MSIFRKKEQQQTLEDINFKSKQIDLKISESKLESARKSSALKGVLLSAISLAALAISYSVAVDAMKCQGICISDVNQEIVSIGFDAVDVSKKEAVYVVEYAGSYLESESKAFRNKLLKVKTMANNGDKLIVNITSNGGDAIACSNDYAIINELESDYGIETITVVDRAAHSCGYYLASASNTIYAQQGASLGNIGSAIQLPSNVIDGALRRLTGEGLVVIGSTRAKEIFAGAPLKTDDDKAIVKKYVDDNAQFFFDDVITSRGDRIAVDDYSEIFSAYPFSARKALELGLVDGLRSMEEVILEHHTNGYQIKRISFNSKNKAPAEIGLGSLLRMARLI